MTFLEETAHRLASALQKFRSQGLLCDVALIAPESKQLAHQVILAASSGPLKEHIFSQHKDQCSPAPELSLPPSALEIQLENVPSDSSLSNFLDGIYAQKHEAERLLQLQELQSKGHLCDLLLSVGTQHVAAHQVVLAAHCEAFRNLRLGGTSSVWMRRMPRPATPSTWSCVASRLPKQSRSCWTSSTAAPCGPNARSSPWRFARRDDVVHLATELKLPALKEQGLEWSRQLTLPKPPPPTPDEEVEEDEAEEPDVEEAPEAPAAAPTDEADEAVSVASAAEAPEVFLKLRSITFGAGSVPAPPRCGAQEAAEAAGEIYGKQDVAFLGKLVRVFWERPIWLEPTLKQVPVLARTMDTERLKRLLPFVAYQWKDGPWQQAYCRLGFDPREEPSDALRRQVIAFKDRSRSGREVPHATEDVAFQRAPVYRWQLYQLEHIEDEYIQSLLEGVHPDHGCDAKSGFLGVLHEVILDRLKVKAAELPSKKRKAPTSQTRRKVRKA
ncbi:General transcription factor 3C polypeptide 5 (TF3C-epsilon) (Transcription factor IIIC 63 kDa subunit) (TFIIIC 63 kDa subunit) (TFIIIC63) (Transcription factor IIIC subunit epsilon) [Durusdinium trenchii]|uniref:General transcription factor 3C polypeptide 5 (TF3C-epsilon) (Transcription factor IIIC 63 kDa subunit) (TFIIIC 63 kDa subunit) (TFIIIC63) (Transcription factor IIIC subunit epsilon) n=1 Tax=Durusdinium trenchii TaxID=1381693 RepID=A0ABP0R6A3_9DINO